MGLLRDAVTCQEAFPAVLVFSAVTVGFWSCVFLLETWHHTVLLTTVVYAILIVDAGERIVTWLVDGGIRNAYNDFQQTMHTKVLSDALSDCAQYLLFMMPVWNSLHFVLQWLHKIWTEKRVEFLTIATCSCAPVLIAFRKPEQAAVLTYANSLLITFLPAVRHYEIVERTELVATMAAATAVAGTKSAASGFINGLLAIVNGVRSLVVGIVNGAHWLIVSTVNGAVWLVISGRNAVVAIYQWIVDSVIATRDAIVAGYRWVVETMVAIGNAIVNGIVATGLAIRNAIVGFFTAIYNSIVYVCQSIVNGVIFVVTSIVNGIKAIVFGIYDGICTFIDRIQRGYRYSVECVHGGVYGVLGGIKYASGAFVQWIFDTCVWIRNSIFGGCSKIKKSYFAAIDYTKESYHSAVKRSKAAAQRSAKRAYDMIVNALERSRGALYALFCRMRSATIALYLCAVAWIKNFSRRVWLKSRELFSRARLALARQLSILLTAISNYLFKLKLRIKAYIHETWVEPIVHYLIDLKDRVKLFIWINYTKPTLDYVNKKYNLLKYHVIKGILWTWDRFYHDFALPLSCWLGQHVPKQAPYLESDSEKELGDFMPSADDERRLKRLLAKPLNEGESDSDVEELFGGELVPAEDDYSVELLPQEAKLANQRSRDSSTSNGRMVQNVVSNSRTPSGPAASNVAGSNPGGNQNVSGAGFDTNLQRRHDLPDLLPETPKNDRSDLIPRQPIPSYDDDDSDDEFSLRLPSSLRASLPRHALGDDDFDTRSFSGHLPSSDQVSIGQFLPKKRRKPIPEALLNRPFRSSVSPAQSNTSLKSQPDDSTSKLAASSSDALAAPMSTSGPASGQLGLSGSASEPPGISFLESQSQSSLSAASGKTMIGSLFSYAAEKTASALSVLAPIPPEDPAGLDEGRRFEEDLVPTDVQMVEHTDVE